MTPDELLAQANTELAAAQHNLREAAHDVRTYKREVDRALGRLLEVTPTPGHDGTDDDLGRALDEAQEAFQHELEARLDDAQRGGFVRGDLEGYQRGRMEATQERNMLLKDRDSARRACHELRGELATAKQDRDSARQALRSARADADRFRDHRNQYRATVVRLRAERDNLQRDLERVQATGVLSMSSGDAARQAEREGAVLDAATDVVAWWVQPHTKPGNDALDALRDAMDELHGPLADVD